MTPCEFGAVLDSHVRANEMPEGRHEPPKLTRSEVAEMRLELADDLKEFARKAAMQRREVIHGRA